MRIHFVTVTVSLALAVAFSARPPLAAPIERQPAVPALPLRLSAFAVNMSTAQRGRNTAVMDIRITRWSTPEERERLISTAVEKGQDALLRSLQKMPDHGRISIPGWTGPDPQNYRLGWNLRYAWHEPLPEGGERIVIATDRQMSFRETVNNPRTVDYPFLLMQIHLSKDGTTGEGKMVAFAQIRFDKKKNVMEIETYGTEPQRLNNITVGKK